MPGQRSEQPLSLVEAWGLSPGARVWAGGHNLEARREVEPHLAGTERPPTGPLDLAFITPQTAEEVVYFAGKLRHRLAPAGLVWVVFPTLNSPREKEFNGCLDEMTVRLFELGYHEAGRAQVGNNYTSTAFKPESDAGPIGASDSFIVM